MKPPYRTTMLACILAATSAAGAAEYEVEHTGTFGRGVTYTLNGGAPTDVKAGFYNWTIISSSSPSHHNYAPGAHVKSFCIELSWFIGTSYDGADITDAPVPGDPGQPDISNTRAALISELYGRHLKDAFSTEGTLKERRTRAAAFALAIWELTHEGTNADDGQLVSGNMLDVDDGNFSAVQTNGQDEVPTLANAWLSELEGGGGISENLFAWVHSENQDQLVFIPLPAPLALAAVGLAGVTLCRRRLHRLIS